MKRIFSLALLLFFLTVGRIWAANVDELLLDHLVEKGIISPEAAAAIRADAAIKTQDEKAAQTSFPVNGGTKINASGYLQVFYSADSFKVRRARLDFKGDVSKQVSYELQIDAVQTLSSVVSSVTQTGTQTVTTTTTKVVARPIILDAYINYCLNRSLNLMVGQAKVPFGRENLQSDTALDTIYRSQVTERLVPGRDNGSHGRDLGIQLLGGFGAEEKMLSYAIGLLNGSGLYSDDDNSKKDLAGRVTYSPNTNLTLGFNLYGGKSGSTEVDRMRTGLELSWLPGKFFLKSEYISGRDGATNKNGWYLLGGVKVNPIADLVVRQEAYDPNTDLSGDSSNITTLGLNWYLNKWAKVQLNYERRAGETNPVSTDSLLAQAQVQF